MQMPVIKPRADGKWELAENFGYVPKGFITDGASVPRFLWRLLGPPMEADTIAAAIRHDYHYEHPKMLSRADADDEFYWDLRGNGVATWRAYLYWLGVRAFGWMHYGKTKNNNEKGKRET